MSIPTEDGNPISHYDWAVTKGKGTTYFIPTEDEWFKAAYYDPDSHGFFVARHTDGICTRWLRAALRTYHGTGWYLQGGFKDDPAENGSWNPTWWDSTEGRSQHAKGA